MKRALLVCQVLLFLTFNLFLFLTILFLIKKNNVFDQFNPDRPVYNGKEEYDPSLQRLTSVSMLEQYCDSLYEAQKASHAPSPYESSYPEIVGAAVRKKFYHGYSTYGYSDNYMARLLEPLTGKNAAAIVIPDDIMKYPYAACSQQSIVMMELLRRKGFTTRKVGFSSKEYGGHFSFEVFYDGGWHYFDPNQEPDRDILNAYHRPGIAYLASHQEILVAAYKNWEPAKVKAVLLNYSLGKPNRFEAPNARMYQQATKVLSYIFWIFPLMGVFWIRNLRRRKKKLAKASATTAVMPVMAEAS